MNNTFSNTHVTLYVKRGGNIESGVEVPRVNLEERIEEIFTDEAVISVNICKSMVQPHKFLS